MLDTASSTCLPSRACQINIASEQRNLTNTALQHSINPQEKPTYHFKQVCFGIHRSRRYRELSLKSTTITDNRCDEYLYSLKFREQTCMYSTNNLGPISQALLEQPHSCSKLSHVQDLRQRTVVNRQTSMFLWPTADTA